MGRGYPPSLILTELYLVVLHLFLPCDQTISLLPLSVAKARARAARAAETTATATKTATAVTATEGETNLYLKEYIVCYIYVQTANLFF